MPDCDRRFFDRTETFARVALRSDSEQFPGYSRETGERSDSFRRVPLLWESNLGCVSEGRFTPSGAEVRASVKRESRTVAMSRNAKPRQVELARGD